MPIEYLDWKEANATAASSLATTMASATATGFPDVAEASEHISFVIVNVFQRAETPEEIDHSLIKEFEDKIEQLESTLNDAQVPMTEAFRCHKDLEDCMRRAQSKGGKITCYLTYVACLGERFTKSVQPSKPNKS